MHTMPRRSRACARASIDRTNSSRRCSPTPARRRARRSTARYATIARLRARKHRPHKPFAVMFADPGAATREALARQVRIDDAQFALLRSDARPVVLLPRTPSCTGPDIIAPGSANIGVLLPYSPLHHLLLDAFGAPLVATSGNVSGEPVISDNAEARQRLASIADGFLHHDR